MTDERHCVDSPCKLKIGDHPFITKNTAIYYKKAREFDAALIDKECASGERVRRLDDCTPQVLDRVISGARASDDLTAKLLAYLK